MVTIRLRLLCGNGECMAVEQAFLVAILPWYCQANMSKFVAIQKRWILLVGAVGRIDREAVPGGEETQAAIGIMVSVVHDDFLKTVHQVNASV